MNLNGLIMFHALNGDGDVVVACAFEQQTRDVMRAFEDHLAEFNVPTKKKARRITLPNGREVSFITASEKAGSVEHCNHVIVVTPYMMQPKVLEEVRTILGGKGARTYVEFSSP